MVCLLVITSMLSAGHFAVWSILTVSLFNSINLVRCISVLKSTKTERVRVLCWKRTFGNRPIGQITAKAAASHERLFDFHFIRNQMAAVILRIRFGIHPEIEGDGSDRFFDVIAENVVLHVNEYGLVDFLPPCIIPFFYRMAYGLNLDGLGNLEFEGFFESFFNWYLKNRDGQQYDFDWEIADQICDSFVIPEKFLTGIFARPNSE